MASALRQAMRYKLTPEEQAAVVRRYSRFGGPEDALAAYGRRHYRQESGIADTRHASADQLAQAERFGALGAQGPQPLAPQITTQGPGVPPGVQMAVPPGAQMVGGDPAAAGAVSPGHPFGQIPPPAAKGGPAGGRPHAQPLSPLALAIARIRLRSAR